MTVQGIIVLILIGLVLVLWVLDLVRRDRLYVGYGVVLTLSICGVILILALPPLLTFVTRLVGAIFPASALTLLALCFLVFMLVYVLTQVTVVSNRLAVVVQELAVQRAREVDRTIAQRKDEDAGGAESDRASLMRSAYDPRPDGVPGGVPDGVSDK